MNIFEFALNFEQEQRNFYINQAAGVKDVRLKKLFTDLAEEERRHQEIVEQLHGEKVVKYIESDIIPQAKKAFEEISRNLPESVLPTDQLQLYQRALEMEAKSYEFYRSKAEETDLPFVRKAFQQLAEEEKKHENVLSNLIEFVNRPNTWLENAEWYHLEEY